MIPRQLDRRQPELGVLSVSAIVGTQLDSTPDDLKLWRICQVHLTFTRPRSCLCRVVGSSEMVSADSVSGEPFPGTRHTHGRRVRRPVTPAELVVLISFGLKSPGADLVTATAMIFCKAPIPIEEVAVRVRCQFDVAPTARDPYQHVRCHEVHARGRDRLVVVVLRLHTTRPTRRISRARVARHFWADVERASAACTVGPLRHCPVYFSYDSNAGRGHCQAGDTAS